MLPVLQNDSTINELFCQTKFESFLFDKIQKNI